MISFSLLLRALIIYWYLSMIVDPDVMGLTFIYVL